MVYNQDKDQSIIGRTMKNVCSIEKDASFENNDVCCMVSISIRPSNLTIMSKIVGRRLINTTRISGANRASNDENR